MFIFLKYLSRAVSLNWRWYQFITLTPSASRSERQLGRSLRILKITEQLGVSVNHTQGKSYDIGLLYQQDCDSYFVMMPFKKTYRVHKSGGILLTGGRWYWYTSSNTLSSNEIKSSSSVSDKPLRAAVMQARAWKTKRRPCWK